MLKTFLKELGVYNLYEKWLWLQVRNKKKPEHVAIILGDIERPDNKALSERNFSKIEKLLGWCFEVGIKIISIYLFSTENYLPKMHVNDLKIFFERIQKSKIINGLNVKVKTIGKLNLFPRNIQGIIKAVESKTENFDRYTLNLAIAYDGRTEIIDVAKKIAQRIKNGDMNLIDINEEVIEQHLYTAHMVKQYPDLIIRTAEERRLSGFFLWQCAYSEICFLNVTLSVLRRIELLRAIRTYQRRKRRFGE
jgi:tritrans,polycis-undecaprenyl-diphosphate synthase [geranylgeranyl-diphosphate specific]